MIRLNKSWVRFCLVTTCILGASACGGVVGDVHGGGQAPATTASAAPGPGISQGNVVTVTQPEKVLPNQNDSLAPLAAGVSPQLTAEQVRDRLLALDPGDPLYLHDATRLVVKLGSYTNQRLPNTNGKPIIGVVSYVFSGGEGPCGPASIAPVGSAPPTAASTGVCASLVVADATTGTLEVVNSWGLGS